jgi:TetR/AcrR family transcriptional repressor of nem operon
MMFIMRYPDGHKQAVRERIVQAASAALRQHGLSGVSIPALMKQAGLTHGAFYAHFADRDELVAEAVRRAADGTADKVFAAGLPLRGTLERYLSPAHLGHPEDGCVIAALGTDGPRQPAGVRRSFADVARGFLGLVDRKLHPKGGARQPSDRALACAAMMVGAVVLGRLVDDPALAARILSAARSASAN